MNSPDFEVRFSVQKFHEGCHHKYIVYLVDLNRGNMSLTNGIEIAVSETIKALAPRFGETELLSKTFWFYKDSEGEYAQLFGIGARIQFVYLTKERAEKILELMDS